MSVRVKTVTGKQIHTVSVSTNTTVRDVIQKVLAQTGAVDVPVSAGSLTFDGRALAPEKLLSSYNIPEDRVLLLALNIRGD